jgi:hypothetical protein
VAWSLPLARFLGKSSRWAMDEADNLLQVAKDLIVGNSIEPRPKRAIRAGAPLPALVSDLAALVAKSDKRLLERDKHFWRLVRELYTRRPWVPRPPRDLVDTVGFEMKKSDTSEPQAGQSAAGGGRTGTGQSAAGGGRTGTGVPDIERTGH